MASNKSKTLWGKDFRVVAEGLAETDVVIFVEQLLAEHREKLEQLDHVESLHELAKKTVEEAEELARGIRHEASREAEAESARILAEAEESAQQILEDAERAAVEQAEAASVRLATIEAEVRRSAQVRIAEIDAALKVLKESAVKELSTRMRSHYIGKHLYQSVHFIPAFESFIEAVSKGQASQSESDPESPARHRSTDATLSGGPGCRGEPPPGVREPPPAGVERLRSGVLLGGRW